MGKQRAVLIDEPVAIVGAKVIHSRRRVSSYAAAATGTAIF